jgi:hypothetical protein
MFTSMAFALALCSPAAPIPKDAPATGLAPRIVDLKPGTDGKIMVQVRRTEVVNVNAGANAAPVARNVTRISNVELGDIKDLKITTAGGKEVELKDAKEKLKDGGIVVMTSDGKPVAIQFLRILKEDTLVLSSPELAGPATGASTGIGGGGGLRPLPAPVPGNIAPGGIQVIPGGGGIQIQIAPGGVIQAVPVEAPAVEPKPVEKK